ncbi:hypothetical protein AB1K62_14515 [Parasphingorhabdus sp. JC815]|uniref:PIN-like domain-containing protein n=1 Tax=Parasphingorhabdus sp. JC815 TaxID=3232140 RepID=UPI00345A418A
MAELTFFFDRCTGSKLPKLLRQTRAPFKIEFHDEKSNGFARDTDDDVWLAEVSKKGWIVISHDKRFHKDSLAMEAVRQHQGRVFYLDGGSSVNWDKLRRFAYTYKKMEQLVKNQPAPFIYRITYSDRIIRQKGFD